ncbi:bifunctional arginine demethylase and lysyl-hydroxylase PSR-like [Oculina patagonica]
MKKAKNKNPTHSTAKLKEENNKAHQNRSPNKNVSTSPYMVTAGLMLPVACAVIYYVISKPSIIIPKKLEPLSPDVSGWQRASTEDEMKYNTTLCTMERREASSLNSEEFERVFRYKKPLIVHFSNGAADWTDPMKWTKSSLLELYSQWSILSGTSEDIVRRGGNGDKQTSFNEYLDMMHHKKYNDEPMYIFDRAFYNDSHLPESIKVPDYFKIKDGVDSSIFFLGGSGSGVSFHKHADAWNGVIFGRKRWFLYPPQKTPPGGVWPSFSQLDWINKVYPNLPPEDKPMECVQEAGEILYLPESYYHGTVNIGDTMAIGIQKYNAATKVEKLFYEKAKGRRQLEIFQELSTLLPDSTEVLHKLADQYFRRGDIQKAIATLEKAVQMDSLFVIAKLDLARYYNHHGSTEKAKQLFEEALEVHPDSFDGHIHYGEFLYQKGDYDKATSQYRQLTKLRPDKAFGYNQLAKCLDKVGDKDGAKTARLTAQELS